MTDFVWSAHKLFSWIPIFFSSKLLLVLNSSKQIFDLIPIQSIQYLMSFRILFLITLSIHRKIMQFLFCHCCSFIAPGNIDVVWQTDVINKKAKNALWPWNLHKVRLLMGLLKVLTPHDVVPKPQIIAVIGVFYFLK